MLEAPPRRLRHAPPIAHQAALDDTLGDLAMTRVNPASTFAINRISLGPARWTFIDHDGVEPTTSPTATCEGTVGACRVRTLLSHSNTTITVQSPRGRSWAGASHPEN